LRRSRASSRPAVLADRSPIHAEILALLDETPDTTLQELKAALHGRGIAVGYGTLWRFFDRRGITRKKRPRCGTGLKDNLELHRVFILAEFDMLSEATHERNGGGVSG
jgi:hypothetical protein